MAPITQGQALLATSRSSSTPPLAPPAPVAARASPALCPTKRGVWSVRPNRATPPPTRDRANACRASLNSTSPSYSTPTCCRWIAASSKRSIWILATRRDQQTYSTPSTRRIDDEPFVRVRNDLPNIKVCRGHELLRRHGSPRRTGRGNRKDRLSSPRSTT